MRISTVISKSKSMHVFRRVLLFSRYEVVVGGVHVVSSFFWGLALVAIVSALSDTKVGNGVGQLPDREEGGRMGKARSMGDTVLELGSCLLLSFLSFFSSLSCYLRKQPGYWLLSFPSGFSFCSFSFFLWVLFFLNSTGDLCRRGNLSLGICGKRACKSNTGFGRRSQNH